ncbi:serine/threonine dehydratase [Kineosporiaceae bacterium SCSIO 59966]|nr:serine/threonine dehydratase [Kineosporiaceae bacterium SCSIO 59966]
MTTGGTRTGGTTRADVEAARSRVGGTVRRTPVIRVEPAALGGAPGAAPVALKLEMLQHTGSFKARGALNALLAAGELPAAGVVAASGGNHGLAVAWAAARLGAPATVFVPETAPDAKVAGLRALGADVRLVGSRYAEALTAARERVLQTGALAVHAYDEPGVVAGQGTVGLELAEDAPDVDTVLVAVGGGGLAGGIAAALRGVARVVGVEPVGCPTWHRARAAGEPVDVEVGGVAADSLGATRLGGLGFAALTEAGAGSVLVDPDAVLAARRLLWQRLRLAVEPGAAVAAAALLSGVYRPQPRERVAVVLCGANSDPADLA